MADRAGSTGRCGIVLAADDHPASLEYIRVVLEQSGHAVIEATDGADALRCARHIVPDLIVLDLDMPELDGYAVARLLRADDSFRCTPLVALTASAMEGDRQRAMAAGFDAYIAKPVSLQILRSEIARLMQTAEPEPVPPVAAAAAG